MGSWNGTPRTWTAGDFVRVYQLNTELRDRLRSLRGLNDAAVKLSVADINPKIQTSEKSIADFEAADWQTGAMWVSGSAVAIPYTGLYLLAGRGVWPSGIVAGVRRIGVRFNESTDTWLDSKRGLATNSTNCRFYMEYELTAGETAELIIWQNTGQDLELSRAEFIVRFLGLTS